MTKPITALIILDGYGERAEADGNAIALDGARHIAAYREQFPTTTIAASGLDVGLPEGQMGNSEVGHLNLGAGRIVYQELTRITKSIEDGDFFQNAVLKSAMESARDKKTKLHLIGLCSDGGVHSHLTHLYALIKMAKDAGLSNVYVHCLMDGRDVPPTSGKGYIEQLEAEIARQDFGAIATVIGRYYAMDRDNRWERVEKAYAALARGEGQAVSSGVEAMERCYAENVTDEFITPSVVVKDGSPVATIGANDSVIFFNFRPDRAREIARSFIDPEFAGFARPNGYVPVRYVCMTQYDATFENAFPDVHVAFKPATLDNTLGAYISKMGLTQLRIAETEKYAHVTFFFNGGVEAPNPGEDRCLIPSPKVATYDMQPEMSAYEVAAEAVTRIESGAYDLMILNFANPDMVGHTGVLEAAEKAIHAVDQCAYQVIEAVRASGGRCLVTADHGNAELMIDPDTGKPWTAHTTNPVMLIYIDDAHPNARLRSGGRLADVAPTLLELLKLPVPSDMTGRNLIEHDLPNA